MNENSGKNGEFSLPGSTEPIQVDWSKPDAIEDGKRIFTVRCRIPFTFDMGGAARQTGLENDPRGGDGEDLANVIEVIASSTSVDFYGTEMSTLALQSMAAQFTAGVVFVPTHWDREWMDTIGRTFQAGLIPSEVENAADDTEQGFILRVRVRLDPKQDLAIDLMCRVDGGDLIGTSIGGWFTVVRIISSEDGDVERIIVDEVQLDHLAATRTPANPDSWILKLRTLFQEVVTRSRVVEVPETLEVRTEVNAIEDAPAYRPADTNTRESCHTCTYYEGSENDGDEIGRCALFAFKAKRDFVCDSHDFVEESKTPPTEGESVDKPVIDPVPKEETRTEPVVDDGNSPVVDPPEAEERESDPTPEIEDNQMDEKVLEALTTLASSVAALDERVSALAEPAPVPEVVVEEVETPVVDTVVREQIAAFELRIQQQEETIRRLAAVPVGRRAHRETHMAPGQTTELRAKTENARSAGCEALATIGEDPAFVRNMTEGEYGYPGLKPEAARRQMQLDLSRVINAGIADGLIKTPDQRSSWN